MDYQELIKKLNNKDVRLSFSSLKQFAKSPEHFVRYKLDKPTPTPAMTFGSLVDCLIFEEEKLYNKFFLGNIAPSTANQDLFCEHLINAEKITDDIIEFAFNEAYKKGNAQELYIKFRSYIEAVKSGKTLITQKELDHARKMSDKLYLNNTGKRLMDSITETQKKIEFEYLGWKFIGYADAVNPTMICDLKTTDSDPQKIERFIYQMKTYVQLAMYWYGLGGNVKTFKVLAIDKGLNISVTELSKDYILYGLNEFKNWVKDFNKCIMLKRFNYNYDFFGKHKGEYHINKPTWANELMQIYDEDQ